MKRILAIIMVAVFAVSCCSIPVSAYEVYGFLKNFEKTNTYDNRFLDVPVDEWYFDSVKTVYEYGLMNGDNEYTFNPGGNILISETVAIASRLHSIYYTGKAEFEQTMPWYQSYVDYAEKNKIIDGYYNYSNKATRADFAEIIANCLPSEAFNPRNHIDDNSIPDVKMGDEYAAAVYKLYRAGILHGSDAEYSFMPKSNITRCEVAAIISRIVEKHGRMPMTLYYKDPLKCYSGTAIRTVTEVTGKECMMSYRDYADFVDLNGGVKGYVEGYYFYEYVFNMHEPNGIALYKQYFEPYIEYLESNPTLAYLYKKTGVGVDYGGLGGAQYSYWLPDGRSMVVSWQYPRIGDNIRMIVSFYDFYVQ